MDQILLNAAGQVVGLSSGLAIQPGSIHDAAGVLTKIDADVDLIYGAVLGNRGPEYDLAEQDATAYKNAGYTGSVPASVASWVAANAGKTAQWAADDILATAAAWRAAQAQIRATRLVSKAAARATADVAGLVPVLTQWAIFVAAARAQLGV